MKVHMVVMLTPTSVLLILIPLCMFINSPIQIQLQPLGLKLGGFAGGAKLEKGCNVFKGTWVPHPNGTYYNNETCPLIIDQQNCRKFGRPDTGFLNWRWKPDQCELPLFDPVEFLEIVRGKSMAFVGDSVGRNQLQSLLCLLNVVAKPEDVIISSEYISDITKSRRWFFPEYNFTIAAFWAPFLVKARDSDTTGHTSISVMTLNLDEPEEAWASEIEQFDYVIVSAGQWFYRPMMFHENGTMIGCCSCGNQNVTDISRFYGYGMAFRTTFRTLLNLKGYRGITFLRTFSPSHFENGLWNDGGNCMRTKPFARNETEINMYDLKFYLTQLEEYRAAEKEGLKRGLEFRLLDTTDAMVLRPDGHPNTYGRSPHTNSTVNDCVHWCVPGPIDTWNEFLLHLMRSGSGKFSHRKLQKNGP